MNTSNQVKTNATVNPSEHIHLEVGTTFIDITTNATPHSMAPEDTNKGNSHQGQVTSPQDGRLKENRGTHQRTDEGTSNANASNDSDKSGQGSVKHPETDKRLKKNRENTTV